MSINILEFSKNLKKNYFGAILNPFCPNLGNVNFPGKEGVCQFLNVLII